MERRAPIVLNLADLTITDHFIARCVERAPFLVHERRKKLGGGWMINVRCLERHLFCCDEIDKPKSITRLLKYNGKTKYYTPMEKTVSNKRRMVYVIEDNKLITIYPYCGSWLDK